MIEFLKTRPQYVKAKYIWKDFVAVDPEFVTPTEQGTSTRCGKLLAMICQRYGDARIATYVNPYYIGLKTVNERCEV